LTKVFTLADMPETKSLAQAAPKKDLSQETDEEIMTRLKDRFEILEDMTRAVKKGDVRQELWRRKGLEQARCVR
jgi:hypothetical protein